MSPKLHRFHRDIYFPPWWEESSYRFIESICRRPITFSMHSVERVISYTDDYGKILWRLLSARIKEGIADSGEMFEFYSKDDRNITKACFRLVLDDFPVDIVLVLSYDGVVITAMTTRKGDNHATLDKSLYERKE